MIRLRYRVALTPAGAGVATVLFPGLLVALAGGQRALLAVSIGSALALAVNGVWAATALRRVRVRLRSPGTATVGQPVGVGLVVEAPAGRELVVGFDDGLRPWVRTGNRAEGEVAWCPPRRGVVGGLDVRVRSSRPLGLVAVSRHGVVTLDPAVHVAPPAIPITLPVLDAGWWGDGRPGPVATGWGVATGTEPRASSGWRPPRGGAPELPEPVGLRTYRSGDTGRDVHWATLARTGTLLVRDRRVADHPTDIAVVVVTGTGDHVPVDDDGLVDEILGRARGVVEELLRVGHRVRLTTWERPWDGLGPAGAPPAPAQLVTALVARGPELISRLARAVGPGDGEGAGDRFGPSWDGGDGVATGVVVDGRGVRWLSGR